MTIQASTSLSACIELLEQSFKPQSGLVALDLLCAELGAAMACGGSSKTLSRAIVGAFAEGVPVAQAESVLLHLAAYAGLGAAEKGMAALDSILMSSKRFAGSTRLEPEPMSASRQSRIDRGFAAYRQFNPTRPEQQAPRYAPLSPDYYPASMEILSCTFADSSLALREREIASVACLAALGSCADQLRFHIGVALRVGVTRAQLTGILTLVQIHAGIPRAHNAAVIAVDVLAAQPTA